MYCKNCGKKLPDDARFCDRCNMSVRKKGNSKKEQLEELKEGRLARRKARAEEERRKKIKQKKRQKRKKIAAVVGTIFVLGIIAAVISFRYVSKNSAIKQNEPELITQTPDATLQPAVVIGGETSAEPQKNTDDYTSDEINGISFTYPKEFKKSNNSKAIAEFTDSTGKAAITVNKAVTSLEPQVLIKNYTDSIVGDSIYSIANSKGYTATLSDGVLVHHRKSIVQNGAEIYYDFVYPVTLDENGKYATAIAYMDENFTIK